MAQSIAGHNSGEYHQAMPAVERRHRIRLQLHHLLVALTGSDKKTRQLHKDMQQGRLKTSDHVAFMVDAALTNHEESKVRAIAHALLAWCSAGKARFVRKFSQIFCAETRNQGELDNVQLAIEQGDHSPRTLDHLIRELDENMAIEREMKEWALRERFVAQEIRA